MKRKKPQKQTPDAIRGALMMRGHSYASLGAELGVTKQHVREVALGLATSARVQQALDRVLSKPVPEDAKSTA